MSIGIPEILRTIESGEWSEYDESWQRHAREELVKYVHESRVVIEGLIGAMPPRQQERWKNIVARARHLINW
jgi:hypothetical protein